MNKNPQVLSENLITLSERYSKCSEHLAYLIRKQAEFYHTERPNHKSDTAVKREWQLTEEGLDMEITELKMKSIKTEIGTTKIFIEVATNIARGLY
jgi:hypothetical protein